jgi:hypothetical protein
LREFVDNGCRPAELASGYALSISLTLVDTHSSIVTFSIHGSNVSGQAPVVVPLVIKVPTIVETLETTRRRHVGLSLMKRKACVLGAIGRIGRKRSAGKGKDTATNSAAAVKTLNLSNPSLMAFPLCCDNHFPLCFPS